MTRVRLKFPARHPDCAPEPGADPADQVAALAGRLDALADDCLLNALAADGGQPGPDTRAWAAVERELRAIRRALAG